MITLVKKYNKESSTSAIIGVREDLTQYNRLKETINNLKKIQVLKSKIRHALKGKHGEMFSFSQEFYSTIKDALLKDSIPFIEIEEIEKRDDDELSI